MSVTAMSEAIAKKLGLSEEPGWTGCFTRNNAQGAMRAGTRIIKKNSEAADLAQDGSPGTVLRSIKGGLLIFYFVEWDKNPKCAIGVIPEKIERFDGN